jgi:RimJ/RimL family protein N-acetyltransferase
MDNQDISIIELRPVIPDDAKRWAAMRQDADARRLTPLNDASLEELSQRLRKCTSDTTDMSGKEIMLAVYVAQCLIGFVSAHNTSNQMRYAEIAYSIDKMFRRNGIGYAAARMFIERLFHGGFRRVLAIISSDNAASISLVRKLGFAHEGTLRKHFIIQGREVDQEVHGLLAHEWQERPPPRPVVTWKI